MNRGVTREKMLWGIRKLRERMPGIDYARSPAEDFARSGNQLTAFVAVGCGGFGGPAVSGLKA